MSTAAQIFANRQNSQHSTGPRTETGRAISSLNHTTHGLCAVDPVLPHENRDEFNALHEQYKSEHAPVTTQQQFLVSMLAGTQWKLQRIERIEVAMFTALDNSGDPATAEVAMAQAFLDKDKSSAFARLERYRASLERTYHRCIKELRESRKQNEANSAKLVGKQLDEAVLRHLNAPLPAECGAGDRCLWPLSSAGGRASAAGGFKPRAGIDFRRG